MTSNNVNIYVTSLYFCSDKHVLFRDFPFLKEISGGSLKISRRKGWFCIKCHFSINTCLRLGTDGCYCVTKGNISLGVFFVFCFFALLPMTFLKI